MANEVNGVITLDGSPTDQAKISAVAADGSQSFGRTTSATDGSYSINVGAYTGDVEVVSFIPEEISTTNDFDQFYNIQAAVVSEDGQATIGFNAAAGYTDAALATYSSKKLVSPTGKWFGEFRGVDISNQGNIFFITSADLSGLTATNATDLRNQIYALSNTIVLEIAGQWGEAFIRIVDGNGVAESSTFGPPGGSTGGWGVFSIDYDSKVVKMFQNGTLKLSRSFAAAMTGDMTVGSMAWKTQVVAVKDSKMIFKRSLMANVPAEIDGTYQEMAYQDTQAVIRQMLRPQIKIETPVEIV